MQNVSIKRSWLDPHGVAQICEAIDHSEHLGRSPLRGTFQASRGFAVTFTREGVPQVLAALPFAATFLQAILPRFHWGWRRCPNAFYMNVLLLPPRAAVGPHVDATLAKASGQSDARPRRVSVLYLKVPRSGGELHLADAGRPVATVVPSVGALVHFAGRLTHSVAASPDGERLSLVCEQYYFRSSHLGQLPACKIDSRPLFAQVLARQAQRPRRDFALDGA